MATVLPTQTTGTRRITKAVRAGYCLAALFALATAMATAQAVKPTGEATPKNELIGTWRLMSARFGGEEAKWDDGVTTIKHVTPSQFMFATYGKDGKLTRAAGGPYTIKGDTYEETPRYGLSSDFDVIKGTTQTFTWKVEANRWYHKGTLSNGLTIEEVWERVDTK